MQRTELASLYKATPADGTKVTVCGWAKTVRDSKNIGFISLSDGSCYKPSRSFFRPTSSPTMPRSPSAVCTRALRSPAALL